MGSLTEFLAGIAPTVATALGGPLAGAAVSAIGQVLGIDTPTKEKIESAITTGQLTPEAIAEIKKLEMQYQADEQERGFKYAELAFKDRDSARRASVDGGTAKMQFGLSVFLLVVTLGAPLAVLFLGYTKEVPEMIAGRVLGLMDAIAMMVLVFHYGSSAGSKDKTAALQAALEKKK